MSDSPASVPEIIRNLNPVTEQFDTVPPDSGRAPHHAQNDLDFLRGLLTKAEQAICDMATD